MKFVVITPQMEGVDYWSPFTVLEVPDNASDGHYSIIREIVNGYITTAQIGISPYENMTAFVHDEGLLIGLPKNDVATQLVYGRQNAHADDYPLPEGVIRLWDGDLYIAGNMVITGFSSSGGECLGIPDKILGQMITTIMDIQKALVG